MRHLTPLFALAALACAGPDGDGDPAAFAFPAPTEAPPLRGPGGPEVTFGEADLWENCAFLTGGPTDPDHHNHVVPYRGHLVMPWAPEWGTTGGLSLFEFDDPCNPVLVGETAEPALRETHAIGFTHLPEGDPNAGDWAVANHFGGAGESGIQFWDLSDATNPTPVADLPLPGVRYPDAYKLISLSLFWQYPYVFVAASGNGVFVVDATDPTAPEIVTQYTFETGLRAGGVFAMGDHLLVTASEGSTAAVLDISDPADPQLYPGGLFTITDRDGIARDVYHSNLVGDYALFARKDDGSGPIVFDISDPTAPTFVGDLPLPGSGGYVFYDEGFLFVGSSSVAQVVDGRDLTDMELEGTGFLEGDLDTITPYGNVALLAVDDEANDGESTAVMPWRELPDSTAPLVLATQPADGAEGVSTTSRLGIGFNEFIEPTTAFAGSIRLFDAEGTPVDGWVSVQEATASYAPKEPLVPGTTYTLEVLTDGVTDLNGNALAETLTTTFTTAR